MVVASSDPTVIIHPAAGPWKRMPVAPWDVDGQGPMDQQSMVSKH